MNTGGIQSDCIPLSITSAKNIKNNESCSVEERMEKIRPPPGPLTQNMPYHDFSKIIDSQKDADKANSTVQKFPMKLHKILSSPNLSHIIKWLPHGRGWKIVDPKALEAIVLPRYFDHGKYRSFHRQINGWGFRRITHNCYYHEFFLRGMPHLCKYIKRPDKEEMARRKKEGKNYVDPAFVKQCQNNPLPECVIGKVDHALVKHNRGLPSIDDVTGLEQDCTPLSSEELDSIFDLDAASDIYANLDL